MNLSGTEVGAPGLSGYMRSRGREIYDNHISGLKDEHGIAKKYDLEEFESCVKRS